MLNLICVRHMTFFYLRESALTSDIREIVLKALIDNNKRGHLRTLSSASKRYKIFGNRYSSF